MNPIDLRSDTVTRPTPAMRTAMAQAEVGDDVLGEDPTINRLQEISAERMGKEAGLFVSSGTMGNLVAVLAHCGRGDEAIMGHLGHTFLFEGGGVAALGGVNPHILPNQADGSIKLEEIQAAIRPDDLHQPPTRLIILENTQNRCGGTPISAAYTRSVAEIARQNGLALHIDGARIFNAAAALNVPVLDLTAPADSITFCLSKGLCAPVGSVLCGSKEFITRARRIRKQVGGAMRQAGILAAAGIIALEQMTGRLAEDHCRARALAVGLARTPGLILETPVPASNMVFIRLDDSIREDSAQIARRLNERGVKIGTVGNRKFRMVTHYWISDEDVENTIKIFNEIMAKQTA